MASKGTDKSRKTKKKAVESKVSREASVSSHSAEAELADCQAEVERVKGEARSAMADAQCKLDLLNSLPTPVIGIDRECSVYYVNTAGAELVGMPVAQVQGRKCFDLFRTPHCNTDDCRVSKAMKEDGCFTADTVARLSSGDLPIRYTGAPVKDEEGNIVGGLEWVLDISGELQATDGILGLLEGAVSGVLDNRADLSKCDGNFRRIASGINDLLDAVSALTTEAGVVLDRVAKNDLTLRVMGDYLGDYAHIKNAVNGAIDNLIALIGQIKNNADFFSEASWQVLSASEQASRATESIASACQQVAMGVEEQAKSVQATSTSMDQLSGAIEQIAVGSHEQGKGLQQAMELVRQVSFALSQVASNSQAVTERSRQAGEAAQGGAETVRKTIDGMQRIMTSMSDVSAKVTDLGQRSGEIGKIVATIDDIAAQTNLLALNAAIEAARAGEQGRGFAVVADEVRKLAERSSIATKEIADLIAGIQRGVDEAMRAMEGGNVQVHSGNALAEEAVDALQMIVAAASDISSQIEQISAASEELDSSSAEMVNAMDGVTAIVEENTSATEEMAAGSTEVARSLESVTGISEENNAAIQEISASAQEISAQVQEVVAASVSLSQIARELQESMATFKFNSDSNVGDGALTS